ncbi:Splicing factor-like protein [Parasponia andersonii]|uniref:Splicing factor-like protein n=1 Tax=Parasponia andersonii TaxID=3476 RepID=A0A2P5D1P6_PARAD|nr:Splicing factor-like protein [Parasponia andersonii]
MEQRGVAAPSHFFDEICFPSEDDRPLMDPSTLSISVLNLFSTFIGQKQVQKLKTMPEHQVGMDGIMGPGSKLDSFSPLEKFLPVVGRSMHCLEMPQSNPARVQAEGQTIGGEGIANISRASWKPMDHDLKLWSDLCMKPESYSLDGKKNLTNGLQHEMKLSANDAVYCQPANTVISNDEERPFNCPEEIEGKTIGNLLPDEDDLFSGMPDVLAYNAHANNGDEFEDIDLFSNGGGLELGEDRLSVIHRKHDFFGGVSNGQAGCNGSVTGEHPYGEHPSRTLFVRNINSNIEDSELKALFEQYGDIRTLYTACKHRGFVMISYYDIRAAQNAMKALQSKPLKCRNLDIHYSIPKDNPSEKDINQGMLVVSNLDSTVSNDDLHQIFGFYGEIKQICEIPEKHHIKFVEFYDVRAAEMAYCKLNKTNIAGKQIILEPGYPGSTRQGLVHVPNLEQGGHEPNICHGFSDNLSSGHKAKVSPGVIAPSCMVIHSNRGFHPAMGSSLSTSIESAFSHQSSSLPKTMPSPMRMMSSSKQFDFCESGNSLDEMKFGNQGIHGFHAHSFPENHDSLAHGIPHISPAAIANITSLGLGIREEYISHGHGVNINRHPMEVKGVFGSSGNGQTSVHEHHAWNNPSSYQQPPSSSSAWRNSPSFVNGLQAHCFPQTQGLPRTSPHILNSSSPLPHHIGSAPAINHSLWERHAYSPETSGLHLGSLGSAGFHGSPQLHFMDISSHKIFSQVGGNCIDMTVNAPQHSSRRGCHIFPGRNPVISMPTSFDSLHESARSLSHRRNEVNSNNVDKRQYELDIDRILNGEDSRTTLMIKNIPNKYTSKMLLAAIDEHCRGTYDFLYLPIDFKNKCNVGYAFINMIDPREIIPFHQAFNGKKWEKFNSEKVATLAYARIQGKAALIAHFQNSSLMNEDKRCRPILFHTDGPNAGDPEPFPMGTSIRSRAGRTRVSGNEENYQGISSAFANHEENFVGLDSSTSGSSKDSD